MSPDEVRSRLGRHWRVVLPGVVLMAWALPDEQQRRVAALRYAGPRSWLAGPSAAQLHGLVDAAPPGQHVFVLVPAPLNPRDVAWQTIRRTHLTDERLVGREPLRYSSRPRALVDAAAVTPGDPARAMVIDAVRRRLVRLDDVAHWVEARRSNDRRSLRAIVAEAAARRVVGTRSRISGVRAPVIATPRQTWSVASPVMSHPVGQLAH
jgi:hypothetical protein